MAKKKSSKKNTGKSTAKKRSSSRSKKNKALEKQESWNLEDQEAKEQPAEAPEEAPAEAQSEPPAAEEPAPEAAPEKAQPEEPADVSMFVDESSAAPSEQADGTKVIDVEDYQPVVWVYESEDTPEEVPSREETEQSESPSQEETTASKETDHEESPVGKVSEENTSEEEASAEEATEAAAEQYINGQKDQIFNAAPVEYTPSRVSRIAGTMFVVILMLMFILNLFTKDVLYSDQENRVFQQFPKFSIGNYLSGRFESQLDNYASDQFAGRNAFIKIKTSTDLTMGQIMENGVFKAKDGYLVEDIVYPDKESVDADLNALKKFKNKYKGKNMYFMLVPNAANILSDKLPAGVVTRDQNKDIDTVLNAVKKMGYTPIDVRDELSEAGKKKQMYYRTDHHWTTDGAYVAYKKAAEVMKLESKVEYDPKTVKKDFVGTLSSKSGFTNSFKDAIRIYLPKGKDHLNSVIRYKDKKEKTTMYYNMDNLDIKDAYTVFGGTNQSLITISTPTKKNRHLLVVKDSYANCFIPFLTQDYRTITIVDPRYYYENIATVMKADEIHDVLFLYNANTFFSDNYMRMMLTNK